MAFVAVRPVFPWRRIIISSRYDKDIRRIVIHDRGETPPVFRWQLSTERTNSTVYFMYSSSGMYLCYIYYIHTRITCPLTPVKYDRKVSSSINYHCFVYVMVAIDMQLTVPLNLSLSLLSYRSDQLSLNHLPLPESTRFIGNYTIVMEDTPMDTVSNSILVDAEKIFTKSSDDRSLS